MNKILIKVFHQRKPSITQGLNGAAATFFYMNQAVKTLEAITPDTIRSVGKNLQVCSRDQQGSLLQVLTTLGAGLARLGKWTIQDPEELFSVFNWT